jgi:hypothetical protein
VFSNPMAWVGEVMLYEIVPLLLPSAALGVSALMLIAASRTEISMQVEIARRSTSSSDQRKFQRSVSKLPGQRPVRQGTAVEADGSLSEQPSDKTRAASPPWRCRFQVVSQNHRNPIIASLASSRRRSKKQQSAIY